MMLTWLRRAAEREDATAAVEFAFIAPLFFLLTFGIITFGTVISTYNAIQQLSAEAARASLAGSSDPERDQLARSFVSSAMPSYPFISAANLTISTASDTIPRAFKVTISYDLSRLFVFSLGGLVPMPAPTISRTAVVLVTL